jgi:thioredoxin-related protein
MNRLYRHRLLGVSALVLAIIIGLAPVGIAFATEPRATAEAVEWTHPAWFKESLLDLRADLQEARSAGKMGLLLVFGTRSCSYCQAFGATTLARPEVVARLRADFDVIGFEVMSDDEVVDFQGRSLWAKDFAVQEKARFTPTLVFYGEGGNTLLRLVGYVPPERFSLVLDYLQGGGTSGRGCVTSSRHAKRPAAPQRGGSFARTRCLPAPRRRWTAARPPRARCSCSSSGRTAPPASACTSRCWGRFPCATC